MASRSTLHDQQYRPVSDEETAANDAASVRTARDIAMAINNAVGRVCAPRFSDAWPGGVLTPQFILSADDTDEHVVMPCWPALHVGPFGHYTHAAWTACAYLKADSYNCTLRLYSCERDYRGPSLVTAATRGLMGAYNYGDLTIDKELADGSPRIASSADAGVLLCPNAQGETFFLLTATFTSASANNGVVMLSKAITLTRVSLDWTT